ncbi:hypothetical protein GYMLUDRAFT_253450 [Collybiopsis luxurians FD-317 M1]|uniref:Uncharacterized protein n=1 Tax=Collybiopsis luxurians FD-317 M1 TaxID=944289 RepID=A0A0D0B771_9AGAR|nr:hypothetical protein GYMLUDRAFT_253450 [Collybiopsis luxurians FD-317 M1]
MKYNEELAQKLADAKPSKTSANNLEHKRDSLKDDLNKLRRLKKCAQEQHEKSNETSQDEIKNLKNECATKVLECENLLQDQEVKNSELAKLRGKVKSLGEEIETSLNRIQELEARNKLLNDQLDRDWVEKSRLDDAKKALNEQEKKVAVLQQELGDLKATKASERPPRERTEVARELAEIKTRV